MVPLFLALGFFRLRIACLCYCHFCFSFETRLLCVGWSPSGFILPYEVFCLSVSEVGTPKEEPEFHHPALVF